MKYERGAIATGASLSLALLLGGCQSGSPDVHRATANLPPAIARQIGDHILQVVIPEGDVRESGTAVRVALGNTTLAITAAHLLVSQQSCMREQLLRHYDGQLGGAEPLKVISQSSTTVYQRTSDSYVVTTHDVAGIITGPSIDGNSKSGVQLSDKLDLHVGQEMILANYQKTPSGKSRDANLTDQYGTPAMFGGQYLGQEGTKLLVLIGEGDSYGTIDETAPAKASSGGAAFVNNAEGSFAGITVAHSASTLSAAAAKKLYGIVYKHPERDHVIDYVEPVTEGVVQGLYADALAQPVCDPIN